MSSAWTRLVKARLCQISDMTTDKPVSSPLFSLLPLFIYLRQYLIVYATISEHMILLPHYLESWDYRTPIPNLIYILYLLSLPAKLIILLYLK